MFDTASVSRVLSILIFLLIPLLPTSAADFPPLLDDAGQAAIAEALHCLKMSRGDLTYKKDYSDAPYRLEKMQRFLEEPLELPRHADQVMPETSRARTLGSRSEE